MRKFFTEMARDKNQTYLQVRWVRDWTHLPTSMFVIEPATEVNKKDLCVRIVRN
jgi:hypothetical protein